LDWSHGVVILTCSKVLLLSSLTSVIHQLGGLAVCDVVVPLPWFIVVLLVVVITAVLIVTLLELVVGPSVVELVISFPKLGVESIVILREKRRGYGIDCIIIVVIPWVILIVIAASIHGALLALATVAAEISE